MCSDCVPPSTAASACTATRTTLLSGCCAVQRDAAGLRVEAQPRARVARVEPLAHEARVDAPRGAELRDLLEQVAVRGEEERQPRRERVDREAGVDRARHVLDRVREA